MERPTGIEPVPTGWKPVMPPKTPKTLVEIADLNSSSRSIPGVRAT